MKKIFCYLSLFFFFIFPMLSAENIKIPAEYAPLLFELKNKDIQYFEKKWSIANETQKQKIIKQQREIFNIIFQLLNDSSMSSNDNVELLAKATRLSPVFAPYQLKIWNFINARNMQLRKEYYDILCKYMPAVSPGEIYYTIQEKSKSHTVYNTDILKCIVMEELVKIQLANDKTSKFKAINDFIERLNSLNVVIGDLKLFISKNSFDFTLCTEKPHSEIKLKDNSITIKIKAIE